MIGILDSALKEADTLTQIKQIEVVPPDEHIGMMDYVIFASWE